jgi:hypothetical protein
MGYSVPRVQSAPPFFLRSYPQPYPQAGQGVGADQSDRKRPPPVVEYCTRCLYTPQQKIFAKVKAVICL